MKHNPLTKSLIHQQQIKKTVNYQQIYAAAASEVPGRHGSQAVADRELLSLHYPRALTARPGSSPASRARETPPAIAPFRKARHVYTDARRNACRCITSVCVPFRRLLATYRFTFMRLTQLFAYAICPCGTTTLRLCFSSCILFI